MTPEASKNTPEDPERLLVFRNVLKDLKWDDAETGKSLDAMFHALDALADAEVRYYYRRRKKQAFYSGLFRGLAWGAGVIGLLLPLLAAACPLPFDEHGKLGYVFLALAGGLLGANSLFGGTSGHVRFALTQLKLEKLITQARLSWQSYRAEAGDAENGNRAKAGFALMTKYADGLYETILGETGDWGEAVQAELAKFKKQIEKQSNPAGG